MKKIIEGKMYNTETATEICTLSDSIWQGSQHGSLYRKKSGEFFKHWWHYGQQTSSGSIDNNEYITPIAEAEALEIAAHRLSGDEYEAIFGKVEE
jgi:hypothetical protein